MIIILDMTLLHGRHQAVIWTNAGTLSSRPLGRQYVVCKIATILSRPQCVQIMWSCLKVVCDLGVHNCTTSTHTGAGLASLSISRVHSGFKQFGWHGFSSRIESCLPETMARATPRDRSVPAKYLTCKYSQQRALVFHRQYIWGPCP